MTTLSELLRLQEEANEKGASWESDTKFCRAARNFDLKSLATQYEAMRQYMTHKSNCAWRNTVYKGEAYPCNCGYDELCASLDTKARGDGDE